MFATSGLGYEFKICGYDLVTESWYKLLRKMFRLWWLQGNAPIRLDFFHRYYAQCITLMHFNVFVYNICDVYG